MKSKGTIGTPVNYIGPRGSMAGQKEGYGAGNPADYSGKSVNPNFAEPGIKTGPQGAGTPANYQRGNPDEARAVRLQHPYGLVISENGQDHNSARSNGDGVILDHMAKDYENPLPAPQIDSPVPREAPVFDTSQISTENRAHLGVGSGKAAPTPAMARDDLLKIGGVMSRGPKE